MLRMSLTSELVALCHREEADPGPDGSWTQLNDEDFQTLASRLSSEADAGPLWVFAYGSLIWKPAFESVEQQRATAFGWHRSFCLDIARWRGSAAQPGLMMALERGGRCDGVIYRLPEGEKPLQIEKLLRREIDDHESVGSVRRLPVRTFQRLASKIDQLIKKQNVLAFPKQQGMGKRNGDWSFQAGHCRRPAFARTICG
ncbi:MAG: hypothetical protein EOS70_19770 [Mesorhizobium sp.]|uniref:gamma-glutamylcyclotransferase n=1 Tax=Mesorhizobium sp. TaxID=1871066 RepID=UPI000FE7B295|nr:gamma-glutamylcyclotransferase [Mesorhizobium sp.]RWC31289.1 MAG: hypothetical protein EOS70_19770 [Mesorhizobium sp.]